MDSKIIEINKDVVFVKGAKRGAIYNFTDGNLYSINEAGCTVLENYVQKKDINNDYIKSLKKINLISDDFCPNFFSVPTIKPQIKFVWLELTELCNFRCIHCYDGDTHKSCDENLTFEQWKDIIYQLHQLNCETIEFIGGEPSLYPRFFELMEYAISIGQKIEVYSNLFCFTNEIINFIKEHNIVVHFSIYGSTAEIHDSITTVKGSFEKTLHWINVMLEKGIKLIPAATILRQNEDDIDELKCFMSRLGLNLRIDSVRTSAKRTKIDFLIPSKEKFRQVLREKPNFIADRNKFLYAANVNTCIFGKFSIQPNGNVSPCEFSRNEIIGNVKTMKIKDLIFSKKLLDYWYLDFSKINDCKDCEYRFACKDCRFSAKDRFGKTSRCLYSPKDGIWKKFNNKCN